MVCFPLFVDLNDKTVLVVGGGPVAARKARVLLDYGPRVLVCAPRVVPELEQLSRGGAAAAALRPGAAGGGLPGGGRHGRPGAEPHRGPAVPDSGAIPVNVADSREESTFLFPAVGPPGAAVGGDLHRRGQPRRRRPRPPDPGGASSPNPWSPSWTGWRSSGRRERMPCPRPGGGAGSPACSPPPWRRGGRSLRGRPNPFYASFVRRYCHDSTARPRLSGGGRVRPRRVDHPPGIPAAPDLRRGGLRRPHRPGAAGRRSAPGPEALYGQAAGPPLRPPGGDLPNADLPWPRRGTRWSA